MMSPAELWVVIRADGHLSAFAPFASREDVEEWCRKIDIAPAGIARYVLAES